jgi:uncharacterized RDD family membrane protein YckC
MADDPTPPRRPRPGDTPLLGRLVGAGTRGAGRVAEATGLEAALEEAASAAVLRALESPAAERAIAKALESEAVERSLNQVIDSQMIDRVWERLLASDEAQKLVERVAQAPEVRQAIAMQGAGLIDDIGAQVAKIVRHLDGVFERVVRAIVRRPRTGPPPTQAGLASRGLALLIDGAILNLLLLGISALAGIVANAVFGVDAELSLETVLAGAVVWTIGSATYLLWFWSLSGETPGMRFLDIRIEGPDGRHLGLRRATRRLVGSVVSIVPFGLGLLAAGWDDRRRTWADRWAQTEVIYLKPRRQTDWSGARERSTAPSV